MNINILVNHQAFIFADGVIFATMGQGLINKGKIPVQELGGQRGQGDIFEGAFFWENTVPVNKAFAIL